MDTSVFISKNFRPKKGKIVCESPSNIALIKYWGKYGLQFPMNPSLSFTLSKCKTVTSIDYSPRLKGQGKFNFLYDGKRKNSFEKKIGEFFERIYPFCPYLENLYLKYALAKPSLIIFKLISVSPTYTYLNNLLK